MEQELDIIEIESKGTVYKNLNLKTKKDNKTGGFISGLTVGNYVIVEKLFAEGYKNTKTYNGKEVNSFSCKVIYKGEEVSFWLNEAEHDAFAETGGVGDDIKVTLNSAEYRFKGETKTKFVLAFEDVE